MKWESLSILKLPKLSETKSAKSITPLHSSPKVNVLSNYVLAVNCDSNTCIATGGFFFSGVLSKEREWVQCIIKVDNRGQICEQFDIRVDIDSIYLPILILTFLVKLKYQVTLKKNFRGVTIRYCKHFYYVTEKITSLTERN